MKTVILAGGMGSRLNEETLVRPKPAVEIGGRPIIWHIMKIFAAQGFNDFVICLGYKGYILKEYFYHYLLHNADLTINTKSNNVTWHQSVGEEWNVTLVDTGRATMTGGRLRRVRPYLGEADFFMTYGDGLADIDLAALRAFHQQHGRLASVTAVSALARFGMIKLDGDRVVRFDEKPRDSGQLINGGFFVLSPAVIDYIEGDATPWEREPLERLAAAGELRAYHHAGFWHAMDTQRDKLYLEELWASGSAPWKRWP